MIDAASATTIIRFILSKSGGNNNLMKNLVRLFLFYTIPIVVGICMYTLTWPMLLEQSKIAEDLLRHLIDGDDFDIDAFMKAFQDPKHLKSNKLLDWSQVAFVVLFMPLGAILIPQNLGPKKAADAATAIALGILTSKTLGYPYMEWLELFAWGLGSLLIFILIFAIRSLRE